MPRVDGNSQASGGQFIGTRARQEDSWLLVPVLKLGAKTYIFAIVCDGMGGHDGGALASRTVVDAFHAAVNTSILSNPAEVLAAALEQTQVALNSAANLPGGSLEMGTTLVAVLVRGRDLWRVSVGDSLLLAINKTGVRRLNADHSMKPLIAEMLSRGEITSEDAEHHPQKHMLRSVLMPFESPKLVDWQAEKIQLQPDDVLILGSDGIETLDEGTCCDIFLGSQYNMPAAVMQAIAAIKVKNLSNQDNATLVAIAVDHPVSEYPSGPLGLARNKPKRAKQTLAAPKVLYAALCIAIVSLAGGLFWYNVLSTRGAQPPTPLPPVQVVPQDPPPEEGDVRTPSQSDIADQDFKAKKPDVPQKAKLESSHSRTQIPNLASSPPPLPKPLSEPTQKKQKEATPPRQAPSERPTSATMPQPQPSGLRPKIDTEIEPRKPTEASKKIYVDVTKPCTSAKEERAKDNQGKALVINGKEQCVVAAASVTVGKP